MNLLSLLLMLKIIVTFFFVSVPFLMFPKHKLEKLTKIQSQSTTLFRLYGVAITSLLIGYSFGLVQSMEGIFPYGPVYVGISSNGGGALVLILSGGWSDNKFLTAFFSSVTVGLCASLVFPRLMLLPMMF